MQPIFLVDLDDNLFQTKRKVPHLAESELVLASTATNGSHSYMTRTQDAFVTWLLENSEAIPVTARGSEAVSRVTIPFNSYSIVANGAVILRPDGTPDPEWHEKISQALRTYAPHFNDLLAAGNRRADELGVSIRSWAVMEGDLATYIVFKENEGDGGRLQEVAPIVHEDLNWVRHHNGNNLALIPPVISKRLACEFLIERLRSENPDRPVLGLGDSVTDFSYLSLCDWWGAPGKSQITDLLNRSLSH